MQLRRGTNTPSFFLLLFLAAFSCYPLATLAVCRLRLFDSLFITPDIYEMLVYFIHRQQLLTRSPLFNPRQKCKLLTMALNASKVGHYKKRTLVNGVDTVITVFRYQVSGSEKELEDFEKVQGDNHRLDDKTGKPLWFTTRFAGNSTTLTITENGKVVADNSRMEEIASMVDQYGEATARLYLSLNQPSA